MATGLCIYICDLYLLNHLMQQSLLVKHWSSFSEKDYHRLLHCFCLFFGWWCFNNLFWEADWLYARRTCNVGYRVCRMGFWSFHVWSRTQTTCRWRGNFLRFLVWLQINSHFINCSIFLSLFELHQPASLTPGLTQNVISGAWCNPCKVMMHGCIYWIICQLKQFFFVWIAWILPSLQKGFLLLHHATIL